MEVYLGRWWVVDVDYENDAIAVFEMYASTSEMVRIRNKDVYSGWEGGGKHERRQGQEISRPALQIITCTHGDWWAVCWRDDWQVLECFPSGGPLLPGGAVVGRLGLPLPALHSAAGGPL